MKFFNEFWIALLLAIDFSLAMPLNEQHNEDNKLKAKAVRNPSPPVINQERSTPEAHTEVKGERAEGVVAEKSDSTSSGSARCGGRFPGGFGGGFQGAFANPGFGVNGGSFNPGVGLNGGFINPGFGANGGFVNSGLGVNGGLVNPGFNGGFATQGLRFNARFPNRGVRRPVALFG